jgi:hypothetical protein
LVAQTELLEALRLLDTIVRINTPYIQTQRQRRHAIQEEINGALANLSSKEIDQRKMFSRIIGSMKFPEEGVSFNWKEWQESVSDMEPDQAHIFDQIERLQSLLHLPTSYIALSGNAFINILLAHCYNLDFISGGKFSLSRAIECAEEAVTGFMDDRFNQSLAHWYAALLYSRRSNLAACQSHLEQADSLLGQFVEKMKYANLSLYREVQSIKRELEIYVNKFKHTSSQAHYIKLNKDSPSPQREKSLSLLDKLRGRKSSETYVSSPEQTSFVDSSEEDSESSKSKISKLKSANLNKPHTVHITIPVDVNALEHLPCDSARVTPDLVKKIQDFNESIE